MPSLSFIATIGPRLVDEVSDGIRYEARINGSLFRINRDIRFSKDKTPYKTHIDLWFWEGDRHGWDSPGLFFRMSWDTLILGAGIHSFSAQQLQTFRVAVVDPERGNAIAETIAHFHASGPYALGEATRKSVPMR